MYSNLKGVIGDLPVEEDLPPEWEDDVVPRIEPEAILSAREFIRHGEDIEEWLIRWKDKPIEDVTCKKAEDIKNQFPTFCLEDKAVSTKEGIDRIVSNSAQINHNTKPKILKMYSRRVRN